MTTQQGKNWCFTINNYTEEDEAYLRHLAWETKYMVFGREIGEQGTPHLQGFVSFINNKRFEPVKNLLPAGTHIEKARGTAHEAATYCKKEEDFEEFGEPPLERYTAGGQTTKKQWEEALEAAKQGRMDDIPAQMLIRYYSTFGRIAKDFMTPPEPLAAPCGLWIYGETGSGKSHSVVTQHPGR